MVGIGSPCQPCWLREVFPKLSLRLVQVLDEDVHSQKVTFMNATQQCFAIKGQANGFLDLARVAFSRATEVAWLLTGIWALWRA